MTIQQFNLVLSHLTTKKEIIMFIRKSCKMSTDMATMIYYDYRNVDDIFAKLPIINKHHVLDFTKFTLDVNINLKYVT